MLRPYRGITGSNYQQARSLLGSNFALNLESSSRRTFPITISHAHKLRLTEEIIRTDTVALFSVGLQMWSCASVHRLSASLSQTGGKTATSVNEMQAVGARREGLFTVKQHIISSDKFVFTFPSVSPASAPAKPLVQTHSCFGCDRNGFRAAQMFIHQLEPSQMKDVVLILERDWQRQGTHGSDRSFLQLLVDPHRGHGADGGTGQG